MNVTEQALHLLKKFYGYDTFRPGQLEIIQAVTAGRDVSVLMPTGGGKSVCFQIPAMMFPGVTIVVSPLIALMNDQTTGLRLNGVPADAIHSGLPEEHNRSVIERALNGSLKLLYISPERLVSDMPNWPTSLRVSMIAIDEAHCISQWGHDFRPVYTELGVVKQRFPGAPVMALTATADRVTRDDIIGRMGLKDPFCWVGSFDRPNISMTVRPDPGKTARVRTIRQMVHKYPNDSGIVYCLSRRLTEDMCEALTKAGIRTVCYHAGMTSTQREAAQNAFISGQASVVCATIAFGMGIDKSNIRWVIHNNLPGNIESYYQEIGRSGRDGLPAEALMFYSFKDLLLRRKFVEDSGQKELNKEKLDIMQRFAESSVCRRRTLLSYFGDHLEHDCGNCDVCTDPPSRFDGTVEAQKAMSAVIRAGSSIGIWTLVDVLRGTLSREVQSKGLGTIKTFGAGRGISTRKWYNYLTQMLQLGIFEIAYDENFHLKVTPFGQRVLRGEASLELAVFVDKSHEPVTNRRRTKVLERVSTDPVKQLFEQLKTVRRAIAVTDNVPDYVIFNDVTLMEMAQRRPADIDAFVTIKGVSERKAVRYGRKFLQAIRKFDGLGNGLPTGFSIRETLILYNAGATPGEIADLKNLKINTIASHFEKLIDEDMIASFDRLITRDIYNRVAQSVARHSDSKTAVYSELKEASLSEDTVKIALAIMRYHERHRLK